MPQTAQTITVELTRAPDGILAEMCGLDTLEDRIAQMEHRCRQAALLLYTLECTDLPIQDLKIGLDAVQTMLLETAMLGSMKMPAASLRFAARREC